MTAHWQQQGEPLWFGMLQRLNIQACYIYLLTGVQIAKMSPFRSYTVTLASLLTATLVYPLGLGAGGPTYINVSSALT